MMRVTQSMLNQNMLFNLQRSNQAMEKYQNQLATGKNITKPSDDPVTAVRGMFYRSSLNEIDQYKRNTDDGTSWMTATDEALNEVTSVLQRVRELTVQGENGANDDSARFAIAEEINQLKDHLGEVANTQMAGRYLFAGTDVKTPPYDAAAKQFTNTNTQNLQLQVGQNNNVQINVLGTDVFHYTEDGTEGIFKVLENLVTKFTANDSSAPTGLEELDSQIDNILKHRAELGARMNRMELSASRIEGLEISTTQMLAQEEDADMTIVITNLQAQENVQRAALSAGARIIQPSLVDFLS
ncbi:flagellar hook-associated protein FlgL [Neobacillus muris]|uniref:flagellar hook-associated protein FlgL n=1 Tax=Neobacillus muris TaxID=2941334 RepID=UPI00203E06F0|nr:flagellar hook-associated protein FlgL [Neobacillus muris]